MVNPIGSDRVQRGSVVAVAQPVRIITAQTTANFVIMPSDYGSQQRPRQAYTLSGSYPCGWATVSAMEDIDIFRSAKLLIDKHGDDASLIAIKRATKLLVDGI